MFKVADMHTVRVQAQRELDEERFRKAVEEMKIKLRDRKPWWYKLFPFVITIQRREK